MSSDGDGDTRFSSRISLSDIDLTAVKEDAVIPDKGTAHSMGRKLNIVLCAAAFVVLFGYLFIAGEGEQTINALTSFNYAFLLLALVGIVVYWLLESLSMQLICNDLFRGFSFVKTTIVTIIGQYFNCITPLSSGGQPMQAYYYTRFGLPVEHAMPMLLCRFIVYQLTMTIYAIIVLVLRFNYFMQDMRPIMYLVAIGFLGGFVLIAMLLALAFAKNGVIRIVTWAINLLGRIGILKQPEHTLAEAGKSLEESYDGIRYLLKKPSLLLKVSGVTFVQLTVYFSLSWVIFAGFGLDFESLGMDPVQGYFTVISCQAFVYLIASFVPLPGAIGASEASYITFFNYVYGDASIVALSTFIWRFFTFYLPIVLGMVLTLMVNNENSYISRWLRKDDIRMAFVCQEPAPRDLAKNEEAAKEAKGPAQ
ncbi:MAG: flippase-like domain-containing protein [Coriobacteriaceae bacterium]|nr:flippase-like domain-containing protein [Coriobacteriaceae bacterium]